MLLGPFVADKSCPLFRKVSMPVNTRPPIQWQWRAHYWASSQLLVQSYWMCNSRDGESEKDTLSHAPFHSFCWGPS